MDGTVGSQDHFSEDTLLSDTADKIRANRGEFLLLVFIAFVGVVAYLEAISLMPQSAQVPLIIIYLMGVVWILTFVMRLYGEEIKNKLGLQSDDTGFQIDPSEDTEDMYEQIYDLDPKGVIKHFSWIIAYTIGLIYVGFWTANIIFPFAYIMVNEASPIPRRFVYFVLWTLLIVGILWILFVELLLVQAIWNLGFLP